jgi:hypothetical protein
MRASLSWAGCSSETVFVILFSSRLRGGLEVMNELCVDSFEKIPVAAPESFHKNSDMSI